jgi:ABC-type dipeptide/oligopeptide/nickel transport system permease component
MSIGRKRFRYILRRAAQAVPVLLAIIILTFLLLKLAPGDAAEVLAGEAGSASHPNTWPNYGKDSDLISRSTSSFSPI